MGNLLTYLHPELLHAEGGFAAAMEGRWVIPSPFTHIPAALAQLAARDLMASLGADDLGEEGKMLGVLVVSEPSGKVGYLRAFSGQVRGSWQRQGWVPPAFDLAHRDSFWPQGQARVDAMQEEERALAASQDQRRNEARVQELRDKVDREKRALKQVLAERKQARAQRRKQALGDEELASLARESQEDGRRAREQKAAHRETHEELAAQQALHAEGLAKRKSERIALCNQLLTRLQDGYRLTDTEGNTLSLHKLFAPALVPGGAGDCAAPKLLSFANREGLRPLALAEFWWGPSPLGSVCHHGQFYPPCHRKCLVIVPALLNGLEVAPAPLYATSTPTLAAPTIVYEDEHILAIDKPSGMLSVPGKGKERQDSALARLQDLRGEDSIFSVHRLDLDTSGVMLFAKSVAAKVALQKLFAAREVHKEYRAWVCGRLVEGQEGQINVPIRLDREDRPRQKVCDQFGKAALTGYRVVRSAGEYSEVCFRPHSGRTHQLRVHASHSRGLGAPIAGDRLYGLGPKAIARLLLHAECIEFRHPFTGQSLEIRTAPGEDFLRAEMELTRT